MSLRRICNWLVAGALVAPSATLAAGDCCNPCPTTCTVKCIEYVPEQFPVTRTTYKTECRQETYTLHRCEWTTEQRVCTRTVYKTVCETVNETRTVCEAVPCTEQRTGFRTCWKTVPVTITKKVMVDHGHYECCQTRARRTFMDRLSKSNTDCCPRFESKKVWVPCMVCEDRCVTCCQRVCEQVPYTYCVTTCKMVQKTITVPCTRSRCVPEQCQYTECVRVAAHGPGAVHPDGERVRAGTRDGHVLPDGAEVRREGSPDGHLLCGAGLVLQQRPRNDLLLERQGRREVCQVPQEPRPR